MGRRQRRKRVRLAALFVLAFALSRVTATAAAAAQQPAAEDAAAAVKQQRQDIAAEVAAAEAAAAAKARVTWEHQQRRRSSRRLTMEALSTAVDLDHVSKQAADNANDPWQWPCNRARCLLSQTTPLRLKMPRPHCTRVPAALGAEWQQMHGQEELLHRSSEFTLAFAVAQEVAAPHVLCSPYKGSTRSAVDRNAYNRRRAPTALPPLPWYLHI
jgi:phage gp16-like protein